MAEDYASYSCQARGQKIFTPLGGTVPSPRRWYQRDIDQIIYSTVFRKLQRKSQLLPTQDPRRRTRLVHTLEVARIARDMSRHLGLDRTLTEAIALGHDLANSPYGYVGNEVLLNLTNAHNEIAFRHEPAGALMVESLTARTLPQDRAEEAEIAIDHGTPWSRDDFQLAIGRVRNPKRLDQPVYYQCEVTPEVVDGIRCHSGLQQPSTLEGQVVRNADNFAYLSQDVDDLMASELLDRSWYMALGGRPFVLKGLSRSIKDLDEGFSEDLSVKRLFSGSGGTRIGTLIARFVQHNLDRLATEDFDSAPRSAVTGLPLPQLLLDPGLDFAVKYLWSIIEGYYERGHIARSAELQRVEISQLFNVISDHLINDNESVADFMQKANDDTRFRNFNEKWKIAYLIAHLSWDEVTAILKRAAERDYNSVIDLDEALNPARYSHA
jgi:dGTP triphosphohydrolase